MSYEGYVQLFCALGHCTNHDDSAYVDVEYSCQGIHEGKKCNQLIMLVNPVDDTNFDKVGQIPPEVLRQRLLHDAVTHQCDCGHQHVVESARYKIPSVDELRNLRHRLDYHSGEWKRLRSLEP